MTPRSPVTLSFKGKEYFGEYEIEGNLVRVFFENRSKTTKLNSSNPELLARLLLIELLSHV